MVRIVGNTSVIAMFMRLELDLGFGICLFFVNKVHLVLRAM